MNFGYPHFAFPGYRYPPYYNYEPPQQDNEYKKEVTAWLQTLSKEKLSLLFRIQKQENTFPILKMYIHDILHFPSSYMLKKDVELKLDSNIDEVFLVRSLQSAQHNPKTLDFFSRLRVCDQDSFLDCIFAEVQLKELLSLMEYLCDSCLFQKPKDLYAEPSWFCASTPRTCAQWIIRQFEKNITYHYHIRRVQGSWATHVDTGDYFQKNYSKKEKLLKVRELIEKQLKTDDSYDALFYSLVSKSRMQDIEMPAISFIHTLNDLLDANTYIMKRFHSKLIKEFQEQLEIELLQDNKKKKRQKKKKKIFKKGLDHKELVKRLSSQDLTKQQHLFNRALSLSNYATPPNSFIDFDPDINEIEMQDIRKIELIHFDNQFNCTQIQENQNVIDLSKTITQGIIDQSLDIYQQEYVFYVEQNRRLPKFVEELRSPESELTKSSYSEPTTCSTKTTVTHVNKSSKKKTKKKNQIVSRSESENQEFIQDFQDQINDTYAEVHEPIELIEMSVMGVQQDQLQEEQEIEQEIIKSNSSRKKVKKVDKQCSIPQIDPIQEAAIANQLKFEQLTRDVQQFTDAIMNDYEKMLNARLLIFDRIRLIVQSTFMGSPVDIKLYGSCVTGLALVESDIDICVIGLEMLSGSYLKGCLLSLYNALRDRCWVSKVQCIQNSRIPVLKLMADPEMFDDFSKFINLSPEDIQIWRQLKIKTIKVDITINSINERCPHLGEMSTSMVQEWIIEQQYLQPLVLVLKSLLQTLGMGESYKGGLSSYQVIIMVYSYLNNNAKESLGEQFADFITFYGNFNPAQQAIGIGENMFTELSELAMPELSIAIFSPLNQQLLSAQCTNVKPLFHLFKTMIKDLDKLHAFYIEYQKMGKKKKLKIDATLSNFIVDHMNQ